MEAVRHLNHVAPRFRCGARGLVVIWLIGTFFILIKDVVDIFGKLHNPPTTIDFANAANQDVDWGPMPWLGIKLESHGEDFGPQFTKSKTKLDENAKLWNVFTCPGMDQKPQVACPRPDVSVVTTTGTDKASQNNLAMLDMKQIHPVWNHTTPHLSIILHSNTTRPSLTFYTGDSKQLAIARASEFFSKGMGNFKGHAVGKVSKEPGCIRMFIEMGKGIIPKDGTCWGFPWSDACTKDHFSMTFSSLSDEEPVSTDCEPGQIKIEITVRYFMVRSVVPHSVCTRLHSAFTKSLGGSLALMTSVFLLLFVRKYPFAHNDVISGALTLRGNQEDERPSFEEFKESEYEELESAVDSEAEA